MQSDPIRPRLRKGVFTVSLDFELAWGTRGRKNALRVPRFLDGTRAAIEGLLSLMEKHRVRATWAIVGALLAESKNGVRHPLLDGARFEGVPAGDFRSEPHWYASDVFERIRHCSVSQEIACHTLTHLCVDPGREGRSNLRSDLQNFRALFDEKGVEQPTSFVFPRGIMSHFDVLADLGFRCYRGPEDKWYEHIPGVIASAAIRLLDAKLAMSPRVGLPELTPEGLWVIPSSQFYSPFMSVGNYVSVAARVRKAIRGLNIAARYNGVFHLWTHPFNLGCRTEELLGGLDEIFGEARRLCEVGQLEILSMGDIARRLDERHDMIDHCLSPQRMMVEERGA